MPSRPPADGAAPGRGRSRRLSAPSTGLGFGYTAALASVCPGPTLEFWAGKKHSGHAEKADGTACQHPGSAGLRGPRYFAAQELGVGSAGAAREPRSHSIAAPAPKAENQSCPCLPRGKKTPRCVCAWTVQAPEGHFKPLRCPPSSLPAACWGRRGGRGARGGLGLLGPGGR